MPIKDNLLKQAELLLKLARSAVDPELSASLVQRAADLKEIADNLAEPIAARKRLTESESLAAK